jgi:hypothetical protein
VVRFDLTIDRRPCDRDDPFVWGSQTLQDGDRGGRVESDLVACVEHEFDVREHPSRVALRDQQRSALAGRLGGEPLTVDQPNAPFDGIDPESVPSEIEERQRGPNLDVDPLVGPQQLHGVFGDER